MRRVLENGKSDTSIEPKKLANNEGNALLLAESVEKRGLTKGNGVQQDKSRGQTRIGLQQALDQIRQAS